MQSHNDQRKFPRLLMHSTQLVAICKTHAEPSSLLSASRSSFCLSFSSSDCSVESPRANTLPFMCVCVHVLSLWWKSHSSATVTVSEDTPCSEAPWDREPGLCFSLRPQVTQWNNLSCQNMQIQNECPTIILLLFPPIPMHACMVHLTSHRW